MSVNGTVGPDHARKLAEMKILDADPATHHLSQKVVATGPGHRLYLAVPKGAPPASGWPILYLLDGNAVFDFLTEEHLALAPGLMLVGVGYDTDRQFSRERRTLDFTAPDHAAPGADADGIRPDHVHEGRQAGGAGLFLERLTGPLRVAAEEGLPVDAARRTLWGHSFGGLFTLYAALSQPGAFARYAAISPSIWWDEALIRRIAAAAARHDTARHDTALHDTALHDTGLHDTGLHDAGLHDTAPALMMALGDKEKRTGASGPAPDGPAPATMDFVEGLAVHPGFRPQIHVLKDHVHIQTIAGSLPLALPFALG